MKFNYKTITFLLFVISVSMFACKKNKTTGEQNNNGVVGNSANALLSDEYYKSLIVEVLYMPNFEPNQGSITNLHNFLNTYLNKPQGIQIVLKQIPSNGQASYSSDDVRSIEDENRSQYNSGEKITVSVVILDGSFSPNSNVLGIAYKNTSLALFGKTIHDNSGGVTQPTRTKLETTVFNHEFGHILGLVNVGSPMVNHHEDGQHSKHCTDENCLMYYAAETTEIASFLIGNDIPGLDTNCKNDLTANGGK